MGLAVGYTFSSPIGITVSGSNLWVSDRGSGTRVWLCTWSGQKLTACDFTDFADTPAPIGGWVGAGAMALDKQRNVLYAALDQAGCILACSDPTTLAKCECTSFPGVMDALDTQTRFPTGLALAYDEVWVTSNAGISRCPLTATGYDNNT